MPSGRPRHSRRGGSHLRDVVCRQESDLVTAHAVAFVEVLFRVLERAEWGSKVIRRCPIQCSKRSEDVVDVDLVRLHLFLEPRGHYEVLVVYRRGILCLRKILQRYRSGGQIETAQEGRSLRHLFLPRRLLSASAVAISLGRFNGCFLFETLFLRLTRLQAEQCASPIPSGESRAEASDGRSPFC